MVTGEPGIGKTRLAAEFSREVFAAGATVLYGRSDPGSLVPYQPLIGALGPYVEPRADALRARLERELRELARFLPALAHDAGPEAPPGDDPQAQRYRLHEALARVLADAGRERPVALLLDDLHWADTASVLALSHVLGHEEAAQLLVVAMVREHEWTEPFVELMARWQRTAAFERVALGGLDERETAELSGAAEAAVLYERTGGNPLFIRELVQGGLDLGSLPAGVKVTIGSRLARLGEPAGRALELASVEGREFSFEVLEAVLDDDPDELIGAVEAAVAAGLVREVDEVPGRFAFSHALVQEALYERQSVVRRQRAHARVGAALAAAGSRPAEVARHLYVARARESTRYSIMAAREAAAALAYEEAAEHYRRALETDHDRDDLLLALATVQRAAGQPEARTTYARAADLARRDGDDTRFAQAVVGLSHAQFSSGALDVEAVSLLEEALAAFGEREDALAVQLRGRLASTLHFHDSERAATLGSEAVAMARRVGEPEALLSALEGSAALSSRREDLEETIALAGELVTLARRSGEPELEGRAQVRRIYDLLTAGEIAQARAAHREVSRLGEALRHPALRYVAARFEVVWAELEDRLPDAWALVERAFTIGQRLPGATAALDNAIARCVLLYREGALGTQREALRASSEQAPHLVALRATLCLAEAQAGGSPPRAPAPQCSPSTASPRCRATWPGVPRSPCSPRPACCWETVSARRSCYELLLPHRHHFVQAAQAASWGSAEYYLGLLAETMGETDVAIAHYEVAAARNEAAGLRYRAAQAREHAR